MPTLQVAIDTRQAQVGLQRLGREVGKVDQSLGKFDRATDQTERRIKSVGRSATGLRSALAGLGVGFSGLLVAREATRAIASFEETLANVRAVALASVRDIGQQEKLFGQLRKAAADAGATTRFSATEAGEGLLFLARAGFSATESIEALPSTLDLAIAGSLQLGEAADYASNILSQFNLEAKQTSRVVDALTITANRSNTDVRQLAEAMKFAGPVAGALGISIEETAASIGALGNSGIQASLAGTNLRGILARLIGPSGEARAAIEALGLSLEDVNPEKVGITKAFEALAEKQLDAKAALEIFGRLNVSAALVLTRSTAAMRELTEAQKENVGEAHRVAQALDNTLAGALRSLRSAVEALYLSMGDGGLGGALRSTVDFAVQVVRALAGVEVEGQKTTAAANTAATAIKALSVALAGLAAAQLVAGIQRVTAAVFALGTALLATPLGAVVGLIAAAGAALLIFGDDLSAFANRYQEFGGAVVALGKDIQFVIDKQKEFQGLLKSTGNALDLGVTIKDQSAALTALEAQLAGVKRVRDEAKASVDEAGRASRAYTGAELRAVAPQGLASLSAEQGRLIALSDTARVPNKDVNAALDREVSLIEAQVEALKKSIAAQEAARLSEERLTRARADSEIAIAERLQALEQERVAIKAASGAKDFEAELDIQRELVKVRKELTSTGVENADALVATLEREIRANEALLDSERQRRREGREVARHTIDLSGLDESLRAVKTLGDAFGDLRVEIEATQRAAESGARTPAGFDAELERQRQLVALEERARLAGADISGRFAGLGGEELQQEVALQERLIALREQLFEKGVKATAERERAVQLVEEELRLTQALAEARRASVSPAQLGQQAATDRALGVAPSPTGTADRAVEQAEAVRDAEKALQDFQTAFGGASAVIDALVSKTAGASTAELQRAGEAANVLRGTLEQLKAAGQSLDVQAGPIVAGLETSEAAAVRFSDVLLGINEAIRILAEGFSPDLSGFSRLEEAARKVLGILGQLEGSGPATGTGGAFQRSFDTSGGDGSAQAALEAAQGSSTAAQAALESAQGASSASSGAQAAIGVAASSAGASESAAAASGAAAQAAASSAAASAAAAALLAEIIPQIEQILVVAQQAAQAAQQAAVGVASAASAAAAAASAASSAATSASQAADSAVAAAAATAGGGGDSGGPEAQPAPYASGGVFTRPTPFIDDRGRQSILAERRSEVLLPAEKRGGEVVIRAEGDGAGSGSTVQNWFITTPDADSFRRSRRQLQYDRRRSPR